ncbi:OmpA family protein [Persicobacter diffluens]|uniref:OmpA-like domain-containing protein n=1 Tax=Persicobacter diffluens TaxID=981 RepID=A0AAN4VZU4_9BACT|nr:hypothetical protein PEDI_36330 [Persicobacter diffluens]
MMKKYILLLMLTLPVLQTAFAQVGGYGALRDYAPIRYAPAWTALSTDMSIGLLHRNQAFNGDMSRNRSVLTAVLPWVDKDSQLIKGGGGLYFLNDQPSGNMGFKMQEAGGSLSYLVRLAPRHDLSLGMGIAWTGLRLNGDGFTTGSQWDPVYGYNPELGNGEDFSSENRDYFSLYGGLMWSTLDKKGRELHRLGVNMYRMNEPTGFNEQDVLPMGWSAVGSFNFWMDREWSLRPEVMVDFMDGRHTVQGGLWGGYHFFNENPTDPWTTGKVEAGINYADFGQLGFGLNFVQKAFDLAFYAYQPVTQVQDRPGQNTFEVAIRLKAFRGNRRKPHQPWLVEEKSGPAPRSGSYRSFRGGESRAPQVQREVVVEKAPVKSGSKQKPIKYILNYKLNETTLTISSQLQLDYTVKLLEGNPDLQIRIVGHSDVMGTEEVKAKIAWERAKAIRDYLVEMGLSKKRMTTTSKSDKQPLVNEDSPEAKAKNRRVELLIFEP